MVESILCEFCMIVDLKKIRGIFDDSFCELEFLSMFFLLQESIPHRNFVMGIRRCMSVGDESLCSRPW